MKIFNIIINSLFLIVLTALVAACTIEPIRTEKKEVINGAPDWVNKGSMMLESKEGRLFYGVASASPQGDMALQKSIADDKSIVEVGKVLTSYLDVVSSSYLESSRLNETATSDSSVYRAIENSAERQVSINVTRQIDEAIVRQFKEDVPRQVKEDISRQVNETTIRYIKDAISYQVDFTRQLEETISRQIKAAVSRQIRNASSASLSGARITGNWRDPKTNIVWSRSELNMSHVKNSMSGMNVLNDDMKNFIDINAEIIFDHMIKEKDNINIFSFR